MNPQKKDRRDGGYPQTQIPANIKQTVPVVSLKPREGDNNMRGSITFFTKNKRVHPVVGSGQLMLHQFNLPKAHVVQQM